MPSPERARPSGLSLLLTVTANCPRGAWPRRTRRTRTWTGKRPRLPPTIARSPDLRSTRSNAACPATAPTLPSCIPRPSDPARTQRPCASPHRSRTRAHHTSGRKPAVHGPARPAEPRPDHGARLFGSRRWTRMASTPLGPTSRRGARLGPALHVQTRRPCRRPPITARYDYDMVFPVRAHSFTTSVVPSVARPGAAAISSPQRDPAVTGPGLSRIKSSPPHPNRALRAPTPDSDDIHLNRRHVTQWCMTRPGLTRTASATVTAAPRPLPDTP